MSFMCEKCKGYDPSIIDSDTFISYLSSSEWFEFDLEL